MFDWLIIRRRIVAVLDYDGVNECDRVRHLVRHCGLSKYIAGRLLLDADLASKKLRGGFMFILSDALEVSAEWLYFGKFVRFDTRTFRVHLQAYLHYPKEDTDRIMRMLVASVAGHSKAVNLVSLVADKKLTAIYAARLM